MRMSLDSPCLAQPFVVYDYYNFAKSLLPAVLGENTIRIEAIPGESAEDVLRRCPDTPFTFVFHLDCTFTHRFPLGRERLTAELGRRGVATLNATVCDISKSWVQETCRQAGVNSICALRDGPPSEPLMVKTNLNCAGNLERYMTKEERDVLELPALSEVIRTVSEYKLVARESIPDSWWHDRTLFIERYIKNDSDRQYRAFVCRDYVVVSESYNPAIIKKPPHVAQYRHLLTLGTLFTDACSHLPISLRTQLARLVAHIKLDYGSIDFAHDDDMNCYAIDINSTPWMPNPQPDLVQHLRRGVIDSTAAPN
jgi:hypothetical protein